MEGSLDSSGSSASATLGGCCVEYIVQHELEYQGTRKYFQMLST